MRVIPRVIFVGFKTTGTMTELYKKMIEHEYQDQETRDLMQKVWQDTPFMVNIFTGPFENDRRREMEDWCRENFGQENLAIWGKKGNWQLGSVTIFGWNWAGFATQEQMEKFLARWESEP